MNLANVLRDLPDNKLCAYAQKISPGILASFLRDLPDAELVAACGAGNDAPKKPAATTPRKAKPRAAKNVDDATIGRVGELLASSDGPRSAVFLAEALVIPVAAVKASLAKLIAAGYAFKVGAGRATAYDVTRAAPHEVE